MTGELGWRTTPRDDAELHGTELHGGGAPRRGPDLVLEGGVEIRGLRVRGHHGVLAEERRDGQDFVVDVDLELGPHVEEAARSDDLADAVDYSRLVERLAADVAGEPVDLLETLAVRLARRCVEDPRVLSARVRVAKPDAPLAAAVGEVAVGVRLERVQDAVDLDPVGPPRVVVSLGSDLGDRVEHLRAGVRALAAAGGRVVAASSVWESPAVVPEGVQAVGELPDFLDAVVLVDGLLPHVCLEAGLVAEAALARPAVGAPGRRPGEVSARPLDVDVVALAAAEDVDLWGDPDGPRPLVLPHPRAHGRAFVLLPWLEVDGDAVLPGHGRVGDLVTDVDASGVRRRDDLAGWADDLLAPSAPAAATGGARGQPT